MFLRAGFNARHRRTGIFGWTRPLEGGKFAAAELVQFTAGDYAWWSVANRFLTWGERCVFGTVGGFTQTWPEDLPQSLLNYPRLARPLAVRLELPYPISANDFMGSFVPKGHSRPIPYVTPEAKAYKEHCGLIAKLAGCREPTTKPIEIASVVYHPRTVGKSGKSTGAVMDLDNVLKVTLDSLKEIVYVDDRQIRRIRNVEYGAPSRDGGLVVEIAEFEHEPSPLFADKEAA